jgi:hypothetical protein
MQWRALKPLANVVANVALTLMASASAFTHIWGRFD